ncbi:hypothetical protein HK100_007665 [Physocladia obscura]|uniref:GH26 domain-containing protein n=1 Tax=Physocladia obscura TaxID=109957 RepID=A0AAD5XFR4_9FUNG|nr:hypothetical protein HK100_007665 [Physocladia obscura]
MNGSWMLYGLQPTSYVSVWKRMYPVMKHYIPNVQIVWSPNFDLQPNDTSYWPGSDYVDVVGTSLYWKGFGTNSAMPSSYIADSMGTVYSVYAAAYNKPFVISEASGAWESGPGYSPGTGQQFSNVTDLVDQATFQMNFWSPILNSDFLDAYPLLEAAYIFDIAKQEEFWTDFKVSEDVVRGNFTALVNALDAKGRMKWATVNPVTTTTTVPATTQVTTAVAVVIPTTTSVTSSAFRAMKFLYLSVIVSIIYIIF